jgi:LysR family transcriptional regulator, low CO2-responsive transcriptional regulator
MELGSNEAIKQAILAGLGIALLSHNSMGSVTRKGHIVALDIEGLPIERQWYLVHRRDRTLSPMAEQFLRHSTDPAMLRELAEVDS